MIPVLTGRQRTVTLTGAIAGHILYGHNVYGHVISDDLAGSNDVSMTLNCGGMGANLSMSGTHPFSINTQTPTWTIAVDTGLGNTATDTQTGTLNDGDIWSVQDVGGSYSFSFVVEEILDYDTNGVTAWPKFNDYNEANVLKPFNVADAPFYGRITVKECLVPGSNMTVSLTSAGRTVTATTVVTGAHGLHQFAQYCNGSMTNLNTYGFNPLAGTAGTASNFTCELKWSYTSTFGSASNQFMPIPYYKNGPSSSVDCRSGIMTAHIEAAAFISGLTYDRGATLTFEVWRPQVVQTRFKISSIDKPHPDSFIVNHTQRAISGSSVSDAITIISGDGVSPLFTQQRYSASSSLTGVTQTPLTLNTESPIFSTIDSAGLNAVGEDLSATRILYRGLYGSTSSINARDQVLESCNELTVDTGTIFRTKNDQPYGYWEAQSGASISRSTRDSRDAVRVIGMNGVKRYQQLHADQLLPTPLKTAVWGLYGERHIDFTFRIVDPATDLPIEDLFMRISLQTRGYEDGFDRVPMRVKSWTLAGRTSDEKKKGLWTNGWVTRRIDLMGPTGVDADFGPFEGGANWVTKDVIEPPYPPGTKTTIEWTKQTDLLGNQEANHDSVWPSPCIDTNIYGVSELAFVIPGETLSGNSHWAWSFDLIPQGMAVDIDHWDATVGKWTQCSFGHPYRWWARGDRKDEPEASPDGGGDHWNPGYDGDAFTDPIMKTRGFLQRYILGNAEGRQGPESPGFSRVTTKTIQSGVEVTTITFSEFPISNAMTDISSRVQINNNFWSFNAVSGKFDIYNSVALGGMKKNPTWAWTDSNPTGKAIEDASPSFMQLPDWLNQNRKLTWLMAMGWRYTREIENGEPDSTYAASWKSGYDVDIQKLQLLRTQILADRVDFYPDCGDVFSFLNNANLHAYGTAFITAAGATFRAAGHGMALYVDKTPANAKRFQLFETVEPLPVPLAGGIAKGYGTSVPEGFYLTNVLHGRGKINHYIQYAKTTYLRAYRHIFGRKRARFSCYVARDAGDVFNLYSVTGEFHRVYDDGKSLYYSRADSTTPRPWAQDAIRLFDGIQGRMAYDPTNVLYLVYTDVSGADPTIMQSKSFDDGYTWSNGEVVMVGTHSTIEASTDNSGFLVQAFFSSGTIVGRRKFGGEEWGAFYTFIDEKKNPIVPTDTSFHLSQAPDGVCRWMLSLFAANDQTPSEWESYDDCLTWRKIA